MNHRIIIIILLFLCAITLFSMNQYNELNMVDTDNELQLITPNNYIIAIHYPKPEEIQNDVHYTAIGILDPEEMAEVSEYKCCPSPYSDACYNKKRGIWCLLSGYFACASVWSKVGHSCENPDDDICKWIPKKTCQEAWCACEDWVVGSTLCFALSSFCALYSWMPFHNKDECLPCKKVVKKVFRKRRDNTENI